MLTSNYTFLYLKNYLYSKPIKGLLGCGVGYCFGFNGQEKDDEVSGTGNTMTAEFWEYDSRLGRRWNLDPIPNPWESQYSVMGGNPIWNSDPKGDTYIINKTKDKKTGKLTEISVSATVYIKGDGASKEKAIELNKEAKKIFKSDKVKGVKVSFKINYIYDESKDKKDLKVGENLLEFSSQTGRSEVEARIKKFPNGNKEFFAGSFGTIYKKEKGDKTPFNRTIFHETGHFLGLPDRYEDLSAPDNSGDYSETHKGFEEDLMDDGRNLSKIYYNQYFEKANQYKANIINCYLLIGYDKQGRLFSPYENEEGIHLPNSFIKR